jgi:hypothetical protein
MNSSKRLDGITPNETWSSCKIDVAHFKVFGFVSFTYIHNQLWRKLYEKGG